MKDDYVHARQTDLGPRPGMELRDWFAGMALNGRLSDGTCRSAPLMAKEAYEYADAMIEQRNKEQK